MKKIVVILPLLIALNISVQAQTAKETVPPPAPQKQQPVGKVQTSTEIGKVVSNKKKGPEFLIYPIRGTGKKATARTKQIALADAGKNVPDSTTTQGIPGIRVPVETPHNK